MKERSRLFLTLAATLAVLGLVALARIPYVSALTRFLLAAGGVALLLWLLWRGGIVLRWKRDTSPPVT